MGTAAASAGTERTGDGVSPGPRATDQITPEPPEERLPRRGTPSRTGSSESSGSRVCAAKEGGTAGAPAAFLVPPDGPQRSQEARPTCPRRRATGQPPGRPGRRPPTGVCLRFLASPTFPPSSGRYSSAGGTRRSSSVRSHRPPPVRGGRSTRARRPRTACRACITSRRGLQGPLPAVQDHAGLSTCPQGRLGLSRPARRGRGGAGARAVGQEGHRGVRRRRVQRPLPRVRAAARGRLRGTDRADGLLGRPVPCVPDDGPRLHRVGVVVAQGHLRQGPADQGLPDQPVLPALRHAAVGSRTRAAGRLRDRHRPVSHRPLPAAQPCPRAPIPL